ncbi:MAG: family 10 glycosylhydrolase [Micromonosporaceae bacterium]
MSAPAGSRFAVTLVAATLTAITALTAPVTAHPVTGATAAPAPAAGCVTDPARPKRQLRAMWIASVVNIDWPSAKGLPVATQKSEYVAWLDLAKQRRFNAVVVQIRPTADAFWPSPYEPWSEWLSGTQGTNPGYDPLAFLVAEAHKRNLEFHAWFNPYRVAMHTDRTRLAASHPVRAHPDWAFAYGGKLYYNPGIPAVRAHVEDAMLDAVTKYDIDGVHFDDYFYPYPVSGQTIPDASTYAEYGAGFGNIHDWRRNNVNLLVQEMDSKIHAAKPWVRFGISPFGIWRNKSTDPLGSDTSGLQSYDAIYADSRKWVKQGWVDYINPQLYWYVGQAAADYAKLIPWWSDVVAGTNVQLYAGQAAYKVGSGGAWDDPAELSRHLTLNRSHAGVKGDVYFSAKDVRADRLGSISRLAADHYTRPALIAPHNTGTAPAAPSITGATRTTSGIALTWSGSGTGYAVWRVTGSGTSDPCAFADARNLIAAVRGTSYTDTTAAAGTTYTYYLTALARTHHESALSAGRTVAGAGPWTSTVDNATTGRFTAGTGWGSSSWSTQRYATDYRFASPVSASDVAWFKVNIPATGSYRIEVWYPADPGYNSSTPYLVSTTTGNQVVRVDQRANGGRWVSLGSFTLAAGDANTAGVSRWTSTSGYVIADAVRVTQL